MFASLLRGERSKNGLCSDEVAGLEPMAPRAHALCAIGGEFHVPDGTKRPQVHQAYKTKNTADKKSAVFHFWSE